MWVIDFPRKRLDARQANSLLRFLPVAPKGKVKQGVATPTTDRLSRPDPEKPPEVQKRDPLAYIAPSIRGLAVPVETLRLDPANTRKHPERNRDAVRRSLTRFGQMRPVVVHDGIVIAGNCTVEETIRLGRSHVAAIDARHLTLEEAQAYAIADNKTAELADWDFQQLAAVIASIQDQELRLATGFSDFEIEPLLKAAFAAQKDEAKGLKQPAPTKLELVFLGDAAAVVAAAAHAALDLAILPADRTEFGVELICRDFLNSEEVEAEDDVKTQAARIALRRAMLPEDQVNAGIALLCATYLERHRRKAN